MFIKEIDFVGKDKITHLHPIQREWARRVELEASLPGPGAVRHWVCL